MIRADKGSSSSNSLGEYNNAVPRAAFPHLKVWWAYVVI